MKRIFPVITVLVLLSLLGLIFFQILWINSARETKEEQFKGNMANAINDAGQRLIEDKAALTQPIKKNDVLFPSDRLQYELFKPSVVQRFSKEEIRDIIKKALEKNNLKTIPFEFAVMPTSISINGDYVQSDNAYKLSLDTINNKQYVYPLEPPSGSSLENLTREELLVLIVPHQQNIIWKQMTWFIAGAILFTIIITTAFFLSIRALLKQKKLSEIKNDFINNMTHEFKTPLATISLAVDALKNEKVINNAEKSSYFTGIIKEENKRMNKQVETILQAALLDKNV